MHPKGAGDAPSCPQRQLVLSKDAGSGLASSNPPPHLSVIKISVLNLQRRVGREGFSEPPGQGWVPAWEQECGRGACRGEPRGTSCSPNACLTPQQGKLRHRLPLLPAWQSEPGAHPHCKPGTLSGVFFVYRVGFFSCSKTPAVLQGSFVRGGRGKFCKCRKHARAF